MEKGPSPRSQVGRLIGAGAALATAIALHWWVDDDFLARLKRPDIARAREIDPQKATGKNGPRFPRVHVQKTPEGHVVPGTLLPALQACIERLQDVICTHPYDDANALTCYPTQSAGGVPVTLAEGSGIYRHLGGIPIPEETELEMTVASIDYDPYPIDLQDPANAASELGTICFAVREHLYPPGGKLNRGTLCEDLDKATCDAHIEEAENATTDAVLYAKMMIDLEQELADQGLSFDMSDSLRFKIPLFNEKGQKCGQACIKPYGYTSQHDEEAGSRKYYYAVWNQTEGEYEHPLSFTTAEGAVGMVKTWAKLAAKNPALDFATLQVL